MTKRRALLLAVIAAAGLIVAGWQLDEIRPLALGIAILAALGLFGLIRWRLRGRRRKRRRGPPRAPIPAAIRRQIYARDHYTCRYCGRHGRGVRLELDHVFPVARGGTDAVANLVTSCRECNRAKGAAVLADESSLRRFMAQRHDAADALTWAARRRAFLRNVVLPLVLLAIVAATYLILF